jgi:hypothetical protein
MQLLTQRTCQNSELLASRCLGKERTHMTVSSPQVTPMNADGNASCSRTHYKADINGVNESKN